MSVVPQRLLLGSLRTLCAILTATLGSVGNTSSIQCTTYDVVTYTRKVLHTTTAHQYDAVFLQVVTFARDVRVDLLGVRQTNTGHLTHGRVRLLRRGGIHTHADATTLRARIKRRRL